jgi:hypothetical protein
MFIFLLDLFQIIKNHDHFAPYVMMSRKNNKFIIHMVEGFKVDSTTNSQLKIEIRTTFHLIFTILRNLINRHLLTLKCTCISHAHLLLYANCSMKYINESFVQVKLVSPSLMPKLGKAGSLQSRQAIVHSLVHTESWAIDLSWVLLL